ncbi:MAG: anthranilate phosphoribosyltransferase [Candidatus Abyssobacteria bacterium SURF_17]|uniref:Anthranilate phosphoribosyltransferase n=1 Tax=Candidatus Abyssobacteria bacterium SURF_17 TaxID=2093361 RepID=A0A419F2T4_9BACT|nr:MAG: anthranilate phosphoribosyltransferase [Candidatus Abyssubacteria bacterium SURF_17]
MLKEAIGKLTERNNLTTDEAASAMTDIMSGDATPAQIAAFLVAMRMKGETVDEITGCARVMREKVTRLNPKRRPLIDTCGTGGDGAHTFNISTTAAFVVAGAGVGVAKHGNRGMSSQCGSADVLHELGVHIEAQPSAVEQCIDEVGVGFMFAPLYHGAMKYAVGPRREIGVRTIFNVLGPLANPAFAEAQVVGVYKADLVEPLAHVLKNLGVHHAFVVCGTDGLDEVTTTTTSLVAETVNDAVRTFEFDPADIGIRRSRREDLLGGDIATNARIIEDVLHGEKSPRRDIVLLNAAFALVAASRAADISEGIRLASDSIDSGAAMEKLRRLKEVSSR